MSWRHLWVAASLAALGLSACRVGKTRLDEHVFHEEAGFRLKVVRYYENLPFHYTGEVFVVQCQSDATRSFEPHATQDAGWRVLGSGGAIGSASAAELVPALRQQYRMQEGALVWLSTVFQVSFDRCGRFAIWDPSGLPAKWIDPVEKPDHCAPKGTGDCRYYDFHGDRAPVYDEIRVALGGHVSFRVRSSAFAGVAALRVASEDGGRTWSVDPPDLDPELHP